MKKVTKVFSVMVASVALAAMLSGCGGDKKPAGGDTIKVGGNLEMTGGSASFGISSKNAIELAFKNINDKGGINGKKLELVVADNKSEAAEATNAMQKLVSQDKVVAVIGPNLSSATIAAGAINNGSKVLDIAPMATNPNVTVDPATGKTKEYNFRACFIDPFQGTVMANFAKNDLQATKAAILIDNSSDYAKGLAEFFKKAYTEKGGTVVIEESYLQKDSDFKAVLTKIAAAKPEVIYVPGYYEEVGKICKQARELGITVPIIGGDGWDSPKLVEIAGASSLNNTYFTNHYSPDSTNEASKAFVDTYAKTYKQKPDAPAVLGYDGAMLLADSIKRAGVYESAKVAEALAATKDFQAVTGKTSLDASHDAVKSAVIVGFKDGKQVYRATVNP
mgnify:FL=1